MERRKAARYGLRIPVVFSWEDTEPRLAEGITRDISDSGAYVLCEGSYCPAQGDTVAIQLILPPIADMEGQGMKLEFAGQVVRADALRPDCGFAVLAEAGMNLQTGSENNEQGGQLT